MHYNIFMDELRVLIPKKGDFPSVYAEGVFAGKDFYNGEVEILLDSRYCTTVYYTYKLHRRLYICCVPEKQKGISTTLPRISKAVTVISQLRGRHFDRYKEGMSFLNQATKGQFYKLPPQFFWQLSILCRSGKNSNFNIKNLVRRYSPQMLFEEKQKEVIPVLQKEQEAAIER